MTLRRIMRNQDLRRLELRALRLLESRRTREAAEIVVWEMDLAFERQMRVNGDSLTASHELECGLKLG